MAPPTRPLAERFWEKVRKADGCWEWTAMVDKDGYGKFMVGHDRTVRAHRVAWELEHGPIPEGLFVCHHCDNPPCVRPEHLFIGTSRDNSLDRDAKGRGGRGGARGERHRSAKLTGPEVRQIFDLRRAGWMLKEIAAHYGVKAGTVGGALSGKYWRHLGLIPVRGPRIRSREADLQ